MSNEQKLREALLSDMDIAVLRMPVDMAFAGHMAQIQYHSRVQSLLNRIEALATTEPTSKQSLQVEPAVNQQLTTEPLDEREAFESEMRSRHGWNNSYFTQSNDGGYLSNRATHAYIGWQARAAMADGANQ